MTSCLGIGGGWYGRNRAILAGKMIARVSRIASAPQESSRPRKGNKPVGASPARGAGERPRAGPIAERNSSQGDDHWTNKFGPSVMPGELLLPEVSKLQLISNCSASGSQRVCRKF